MPLRALFLVDKCFHLVGGERGGLVVESLIPEREVGGSISTSVVLCS